MLSFVIGITHSVRVDFTKIYLTGVFPMTQLWAILQITPPLWTLPKNKTFADPKRASEAVQQQRHSYHEQRAEWDPHGVIFLDERGATLNLTPLYGRSPKGTRA